MTVTDACVCPYPAGDSSIRRMALEARELGYDSLVAMGVPSAEYHDITVHGGALVRNTPAHEAAAQVKKLGREGKVVCVQAGDNGFNRSLLGVTGLHVLSGVHLADRHAFDHVAAKMASDNHVAIDISLEPLLRQRSVARQKALNRYLDILLLFRRYEFPLVLSTHARSVLEMRPVREVTGIVSLLGLDPAEAGHALGGLRRLLSRDMAVQVIL